LFEVTQDICGAAGLIAYEVSNHARPGAESRHNLIYWRGGDYAGIGPGAHGRLPLGGARVATEALRMPEAWLLAVESRGNGELPRTALTPRDEALEYVLMGLRITEGLDLERFEQISGRPLEPAAMEELESLGMIEIHKGMLRATSTGRPLLNALIRRLTQTL
jgi:oxygen-independent coproporphyrinogen-3 oxidase